MRHNAGRFFTGALVGMGLLGFGATAMAGKPPAACVGDVYADGRGAWPSIQSCIDDVTKSRCLVCDGTYTENIDFKGRAVTVQSVNGAGKTTIDGGGDVIHDTVVKFVSGEGPTSVLDGFTIRNGRGYFPGYGERYGGGIALDQLAAPTIKNCTITDNRAVPGEALYGGGIGGVYDSGPVAISNCTITNNSAFVGGGIGLGGPGSVATIANTTLSGNSASDNGGGVNIGGYMSANITNCTVSGNSATFAGGGISAPTHGTVKINGAKIHGNSTTNDWPGHLVYGGGGVFFNGGGGNPGTLEIRDSYIYKNTSLVLTGGVHVVYDGFVTIANSMIWSNPGGGVSIFDINRGYGSAAIVNTTIAYNPGNGGIVCAYGTDALTVTNSIVWGNSTAAGAEQILLDAGYGSLIDVTYSDVQGNWPGTGNFDANPLFVSTANADPALWNLDIQSGSPCINRGDPASFSLGYPIYDIHKAPRALSVKGDGKWDCGADEYRRR